MIVSGAAPSTVGATLALDCSGMAIGKITCGDTSLTPADVFDVFGSIENIATGLEPNLYLLGTLTGSSGALPPLTPPLAIAWTRIVLQRVAGSGSGPIEAQGAAWSRAPPTTRAIPSSAG